MYAETFRPNTLDDIIGHVEAKKALTDYLSSTKFPRAIMLSGPPGIGKTTLALCAAKTLGFEPLEINASRSIRSFEDVEKIKDACRSSMSICSFIRGDRKRTCIILDEVDGSDPHAQGKIIEWIKDQNRKVPILCTGNELPTIFKRNTQHIDLIRCFPPKASELSSIFQNEDIQILVKECHYDIRKMFHRVQYGTSYVIPTYKAPPTGCTIEKTFILRQKMFDLPDVLHEYRVDIQDISRIPKTKTQYKFDGKHVRTAKSDTHRI
jgi:hypothetical protein